MKEGGKGKNTFSMQRLSETQGELEGKQCGRQTTRTYLSTGRSGMLLGAEGTRYPSPGYKEYANNGHNEVQRVTVTYLGNAL